MVLQHDSSPARQPLKDVGTQRTRVQVVIRQRIQSGEYPESQPLPSERALAEELDVNRRTVHRALEELTAEGCVQRRGQIYLVSHNLATKSEGVLSNTIVVICTLASLQRSHHQSGWIEFLDLGILHAIQAAGFQAMCVFPHTITDERLQQLIHERPYGVIISDLRDHTLHVERPLAETFHESGIPVVLYGNGEMMQGFDRVASDHETGQYLETRWLLQHGYRHIHMLWVKGRTGTYWYQDRRAGYERAMREMGVAALPTIEIPTQIEPTSAEEFYDATHTLAGFLIPYLLTTEPADALISITDGTCLQVAAACRLFTETAVGNVAVAGYDNFWMDCPERKYADVAPTITVDKQNWRLGQALTTLLVERVQEKLPDEPQCRMIIPKLIVPTPKTEQVL